MQTQAQTLNANLNVLVSALKDSQHRLKGRSAISLLQAAWPGHDVETASKAITGEEIIPEVQLKGVLDTLNTWARQLGYQEQDLVTVAELSQGKIYPVREHVKKPDLTPQPTLRTTGRQGPKFRQQQARRIAQSQNKVPISGDRLEHAVLSQFGSVDAFTDVIGVNRAKFYSWRNSQSVPPYVVEELGLTPEKLLEPLLESEMAELQAAKTKASPAPPPAPTAPAESAAPPADPAAARQQKEKWAPQIRRGARTSTIPLNRERWGYLAYVVHGSPQKLCAQLGKKPQFYHNWLHTGKCPGWVAEKLGITPEELLKPLDEIEKLELAKSQQRNGRIRPRTLRPPKPERPHAVQEVARATPESKPERPHVQAVVREMPELTSRITDNRPPATCKPLQFAILGEVESPAPADLLTWLAAQGESWPHVLAAIETLRRLSPSDQLQALAFARQDAPPPSIIAKAKA